MFICKFCSKECKNSNSLSNHQRMCPMNLDRKYVSYTSKEYGHTAWNKGLDKSDERVLNLARKISEAERQPLSVETKAKISAGCKGKNGGYRETAGRSKKFYVEDSFGKNVCLQSTYELRTAEILDKLGIKWIRPLSLKYDDRKYYADFYLPEANIWLDPKNDYKAKCDAVKIRKVIEQNNIKLFILSNDQINESYIRSIAQK